MPRRTEFQYTKLTGKLTFLLRRAREVGPPAKVDEAWLRSVKAASSDPQSIIRVLKFVHLIGRDGRPEDLWDTISKQTPENRIRFASTVRQSYARLFNDYPDAHREDDETLRIFFDDPELGKEVVQAKLRTFRSLIPFGDFDAGAASSANATMNLPEFVKRVRALETAAHELIEEHEEIRNRMVVLEPLRERLNELHLEKNVQLQDSLLAAEAGLFRPAQTMSWGGFLDYLCEYFPLDAVKREHPAWQVETTQDLRRQGEKQLVETGKKLGLYSESVKITLLSLLNDRNRLSHGVEDRPGINETVSFLKSLFRSIEHIQSRRLTRR